MTAEAQQRRQVHAVNVGGHTKARDGRQAGIQIKGLNEHVGY